MTASWTANRAVVLGRYDADDLLAMFTEAGVLASIAKRGFTDPSIAIDDSASALTHVRMLANKQGSRFVVLDACLTEVTIANGVADPGGTTIGVALELLFIYWLREQDPTAPFDALHPRLPLQEHPGLGVLKRAFSVALRIARELGKQGIAARPKFFHDAAIFFHSRLFLFLDPREQGRFEALLRDLAALPLPDASLALVGNAVRDDTGSVVAWQPGLQVMPLDDALIPYFHGDGYQAACRKAFEASHFTVNPTCLREARNVFVHSIEEGAGSAASR